MSGFKENELRRPPERPPLQGKGSLFKAAPRDPMDPEVKSAGKP